MGEGFDIQLAEENFADDIAGGDTTDRAAACLIFRTWLTTALAMCSRKDVTPEILFIVRGIATAEYNRRGDEGAKSVSVGGQSITYEDLPKRMLTELVAAGQRVYRL